MPHFRLASVTALVFAVGTFSVAVADEAADIKQIVREYLAAFDMNEFGVLKSHWLKAGKVVLGRTETANNGDLTYDLEKWQERKLLLPRPPLDVGERAPQPMRKYSEEAVALKGAEATFRLRSTDEHEDTYDYHEFHLRKTAAGWRINADRNWVIKPLGESPEKLSGRAEESLRAAGKVLDKAARDRTILSNSEMTNAARDLLLQMFYADRFREAHELLKKWMALYGKIPEPKDLENKDQAFVLGGAYYFRGVFAVYAGDHEDARASYRKALTYDGTLWRRVPEVIWKEDAKK